MYCIVIVNSEIAFLFKKQLPETILYVVKYVYNETINVICFLYHPLSCLMATACLVYQ